MVDDALVERVDRVDRGATNRDDDFEFDGVDLVDGVLDVRPRGLISISSSSLKLLELLDDFLGCISSSELDSVF